MVGVGARGDGVLTVEGEPVRVLFTNRALADAEAAVGRTVLQIVRDFESLGIRETAQLLRVAMDAARRDDRSGTRAISMEDAWRVMDAVGFAEVATLLVQAISAVLSYKESRDPKE